MVLKAQRESPSSVPRFYNAHLVDNRYLEVAVILKHYERGAVNNVIPLNNVNELARMHLSIEWFTNEIASSFLPAIHQGLEKEKSANRQEWNNLRIDLESQVANAINLNSRIQSELDSLDKARSERLGEERDLQDHLGEKGKCEDVWKLRYVNLESYHQELQRELKEQQKVTDKVRIEATTFLREMQALSGSSGQISDQESVSFQGKDVVLKQLQNTKFLPLTTSETVRIRRALYRYELYCALFGPKVYMLPEEEIASLYLQLFPPWEVEELACVHDYLQNRLSIFDDISYRKWEQGLTYQGLSESRMKTFRTTYQTWRSFYLENSQKFIKRHFATYGLSVLRKVLTFQTYEERNNWFQDHKHDAQDRVNTSRASLAGALQEPNDTNLVYAKLWAKHFSQSLNHKGPSDGWRWANNYRYNPKYYEPEKADLREWCYCFWDKERLSSISMFHDEWNGEHFQAWDAARIENLDREYWDLMNGRRTESLALGG